MDKKITVQDVFQQFLPKYSEVHRFSSQQQLTALGISKCRTIEMSANLSECEDCHRKYIHYNSCKNRHCPMCQGMEVDEWIDKQQENVLDVPYFHTVFTVPKELYPLMYCNQRILGMTDQKVTNLVKDNRNGGRYIPHTIKGIDFWYMMKNK